MTTSSGDLTILCVTNQGAHAQPFLDRMSDDAERLGARVLIAVDGVDVHGGGYLESVLDQAVALCPDGYILRLDDDETIDVDVFDWLADGGYRAHDHWSFRRANLWPDALHYILNEPLWPDLQTRLSVKEKSGDRPVIHQGSPYGSGHVAPGLIEHHKFLVRPLAERKALVERYEAVREGAGREFRMFSVPEWYEDDLRVAEL